MKSEALVLMSQDMEQCKTQRDQFKFMAEQIQERFLRLKKQMCDTKELSRYLIQVKKNVILRLSIPFITILSSVNNIFADAIV